jgi:hypothetical protein
MARLTVSRAKDREAMAKTVREIFALSPDSDIELRDGYLSKRSIAIEFRHHLGLAVTVEFDGDSQQDRAGQFCLAWHISGKFVAETYTRPESKISEAFGVAMRSTVNQYHHAKCTAFADGFEDLCSKLRAAVAMLNDGTAYRQSLCQWFVTCDHPATTTEPHPILGAVPICDRCKAKIAAIAAS